MRFRQAGSSAESEDLSERMPRSQNYYELWTKDSIKLEKL